jgi:pyruvate,water dikinase
MIIHQTSQQKPNSQKMGGKGANLLYLSQRKYLVPRFFILTTSIFDQLVKNKSNKVIAKTQFPAGLTQEIYQHFNNLNCQSVSVRSSINIEDGRNYSFAGIFESFLNVNKKDLLNQIKKCWASTFSKRVKQYCRFHKIDFKTLKPAVIIQKMIKPDKGGVIFTQDPANHLVIEACHGNGKKVVDGIARVSHYLISRKTMKPESKTNELLSNAELRILINTALNIEKEFNFPQDIEWAIKKEQLYLLQSRPITTLF